MEKLKIEEGVVYLSEKRIDCVKNYKIISSAADGKTAELTLVIDVSTVQVEP